MTRMAILSKWERPYNMADIITGIRIVCSIALLFCPLFSQVFYALYITAGISDMIDGFQIPNAFVGFANSLQTWYRIIE